MPHSSALRKANALISKFVEPMGDTHATAAMLEIADRCNETCVHCYQVQGQKGELSTAEWKQVMDELVELGVLILTLSGGEATLRSDFLELVAYARQRGFMVKLFTNGLTMSRELAQRLGELALQEAQISLYSHRPETHDWVTGVDGSHARTLNAVRYLREAGVRVLLKTPLMSINIDEIADYAALAARLDADYTFDTELKNRENGDRDPQALAPTAEQLERFWTRMPELRELRARPRTRTLEDSPCGACRAVNVEPNGEVRACSALTVPLGNATQQGVLHAYRENPTSRFIRSVTWNDLLGCRECDLRDDCPRCFSEARFEGGDAMAPYLSACRAALSRLELRLGRTPVVEGCRDRAAPLGPFRALAEGRLQAFEVEKTERDQRIREQQPWVTSQQGRPAVASAAETGLVQIRRPGRKKPIGGSLPVAGAGR